MLGDSAVVVAVDGQRTTCFMLCEHDTLSLLDLQEDEKAKM
jgi:hypothetical protein